MTRHDFFEYHNLDPTSCGHDYAYQVNWWRVDDKRRPDLLGPKAFASVGATSMETLLLAANGDGEIAEQASAACSELRSLLVMMADERGLDDNEQHYSLLTGDLDVLPEVEEHERDDDSDYKISEDLK